MGGVGAGAKNLRYLLDTHTVIWAAEGDERLGPEARRIVKDCPIAEVGVASVSLLEIAMLSAKRRIRTVSPLEIYLRKLEAHFPILFLDGRIAADAVGLPLDSGDPFDRVIVATARSCGVPLFSRDRAIQSSGLVKVVW